MRASAVVVSSGLVMLAACSKPAAPAQETTSAVTSGSGAEAPAPPRLSTAQKQTLLSQLPAAYQGADLDNGQAKFAICKSCHTVAQGGGAMTGPNLYGVFGRKAGTSPGYAYSDGLKALGITWDADKIDTWISNPRAMVTGTKMTYIGMQDPKDRIDLVAYLKTATSAAPAS